MILCCMIDVDCLFIEYGLDLLGMFEMCIYVEIEIGICLIFKVIVINNIVCVLV